ncbi:NAD-dependent succinate-semialdehyde dehydrogenase [Anabaena aphanizomenioides LEGE 00250]|uniref:NAD-dependent succinate-semialdehyde dehydrogenase n=1 Tax=Sphaerospermopsis aphanizomenoides LEGE 00250 TaxID=2777972 RepID=A0ABR9VHJ0_9CYAN|nr:NAD-dependent succinate-semialdehyde dehydrogenase [Sphaerospermopsis aphanizomenoides]MBE9237958.1 NAD-dependent succinate-semialdehyde dehydrogenase [Sphaerospermopsis aphanizomenoides LEGE 00250]
MAIATINPATGETLKVFEPLEDGEIAAKVELAQQSFQEYRQTSFEERSQWLLQAVNILEQEKADFAKIMTLEMGKTLKSAIAEVEKCALVCRYYAENAASFLADVTVKTDASHSFIKYQPLGVILAVMPWNFPFWQVFRFAAPALMAGNVGLLKHASNVPQCALAIEDIFHRAGFPKGVFQTLLIGATKVADLMADDRIKAATLTGSEPAGASLAVASGKQIKKTVLELGGSDPFIVLESADLELAVATAVTARMINNGQSCIAAKRFIVADQIADEFEKMLLAKFQTLKIGDPLADDTDIGPLATPDILQDLENQVKIAVENGAKVLTGGNALKDQPGNFYPPTIIIDIPVENPIAKEEFFGPVALLFRVRDINEAIKLANDIPFGLGASAWTNNEAEKNRLIQEIEAGAVFINGMVKSDPRLPFGGIKRSGYGRELSIQGIHEFVNIKTVWMR